MSSERSGLEIAIIGMAGRFPKAGDLEQFWRNLRDGVEGVTFFTDEELLGESNLSPALIADPNYVRAAAILDGIDLFDAEFFDITPREAEILDPQQRLLLECAWQALESAGYIGTRRPVGVFAGTSQSTYLFNNILPNSEIASSVGGLALNLASEKDFLATRLSYKLNLEGPSMTVQTACSTSLTAVHMACQNLLAGECELALAGGVSVRVPQKAGYLYQAGSVNSPDGHCRAFDARAQGTVGGQGVGVVVLKLLEDALADGDHVLAVIKGSAMNNDGSLKAGFTAPRRDGQARAIRAAQLRAEVEPDTITYVETHGTATPLGDPIEIAALTKAFRQGTDRRNFCAVGSVKTNVGHLDAAAGVTSLIKATLALEHGEIPPSLHFESPNPQIEFASSPFYVASELIPWEANGMPRRAGVSAFGMGGTNVHVILEEAPAAEPSGPSRPWQLLSLSARSPEALEQMTDELAKHLEAHPDANLADVAFTLHVGRKPFAHRRTLVVSDPADPADPADTAKALGSRDPRRLWSSEQEPGDRSVAFLLPGVGDHYPGMAMGLYEAEEVFRREVDRCAELLKPLLGLDLREALRQGAAKRDGGMDLRAMLRGVRGASADSPLNQTHLAQPAVFVIGWALAQLWMSWGVRPQALLGYSLGEYTAACLAGVLSLEDGLALVARRARMISELPGGAMVAVSLPEEEALKRLTPELSLSAVTGPGVCVVSGPMEAVDAFEKQLGEEGVAVRRLPTTHAFHSRMMEPIRAALAEEVGRLRLSAPRIPYLSNVTGTWITAEEATDPGYWTRHLCEPVRFGQAVEGLWSEAGRVLLEVGPGQGLSTLAMQHPASRDGVAIPSLPHAQDRQPDEKFVAEALAKLWLAGVAIDWPAFYQGQERHRLPLPTYPFQRQRFWIDPPRREAARALPASAASEAPAVPAAKPVVARNNRPKLRNAYVAPATEPEARLVELWQALLGVDPVGIHDNFFELGGHSLLGTQMMARLRTGAGIELPLSALFECPTVAELADKVGALAGTARPPIRPRPAGLDQVPLSYAQQRLWFIDQLEPGNPFYNISTAYRWPGPVEPGLLRAALNELVRRHESLRTTFAVLEGRPVQVISPAVTLEVPVLDLSALPEEVRGGQARRWSRGLALQPFDLAGGPLLRLGLLRQGEREHVLLLVFHHIVSDGWSFQVALAELRAIYTAFAQGLPSPLPELAVQYPDYSLWQREWLEGGALAEQLDWWKDELAGAPPTLDLPTDRPRPPVQTHVGATERIGLPPELAAGLSRVAMEAGGSSFMVLHAAFQILLYRYSGQNDILIGTPVANRTQQETEALIGFFVNTLVLRTDLSGDPDFRELLARVRRSTLGAYDHQDVPFDRLVEELRPERSLSHTPLFQVLFQLLNQPGMGPAPASPSGGGAEGGAQGASLDAMPVDAGIATFDLTFSLYETPNAMAGMLEYNVDLFDGSTIRSLLGHFRNLLEGIAAGPVRRLSDLPLLGEAERGQLLLDWSGAREERVGGGLLHRLFEERARERPGDPAVLFEDQSLTYGELDVRANRLAHHLLSRGVGPEVPVGLFVERSPEAMVGILGILKAGGCYVPIDPEYPTERVGLMLRDAGAVAVLTQERLTSVLGDLDLPVIRLDADWEQMGEADHAPDVPMDGNNPIYVIFTSGSLGRPKGVVGLHGALANFSRAIAEAVGLGPQERMFEFASLSFDASALQIFPTLISGAALVLHRHPGRLSPAEIVEVCERQGVTVLDLPAAVWRQWIDDMAGREGTLLPGVRVFMTGGESLPAEKLRSWARLPARRARLFSSYGPTEATVTTTLFAAGSEEVPGLAYAKLPLGRPLPGTRVYLLDRHRNPVPAGVPGEVYIGGAGLARGYLDRPDLTAEAFVPSPFPGAEAEPGERLYRTGDLARFLRDGQLEFLGRADHQVKIRGFRVELGEIEALLASHPAVREAVVLLREDTPGDRRLAAYVLPEEGSAPTLGELRTFLGSALPDFMVPSFFAVLDELPLLPSGKVDRRALPAPDGSRLGGSAEFVAPRSPIEHVLAEVWRQVLNVERVGVFDNFFEIGGHSLLATQVLTRLRQTFEMDLDLPLRRLFEAPTVASLAEALLERPEQRERLEKTAEALVQIAGMSEEEIEAMLLAESAAEEESLA
jgi:amino acid adenylation domain-containing protein